MLYRPGGPAGQILALLRTALLKGRASHDGQEAVSGEASAEPWRGCCFAIHGVDLVVSPSPDH